MERSQSVCAIPEIALYVLSLGLGNFVIPLPLDSANAVRMIEKHQVTPSVIHVDGAHDFDAALSDLRRWWPLLAPGGYLICDDYDEKKVIWPAVQRAVEVFLAATPHANFEATPDKCRFQKPT
jgi:cephalosporin hydroxylase